MDLRTPLGLLFALLGLLLVGYGLASDPGVYAASLTINVNAWTGSAMALFGAGMLVLASRARRGGPRA
jgi:hypothetical protein